MKKKVIKALSEKLLVVFKKTLKNNDSILVNKMEKVMKNSLKKSNPNKVVVTKNELIFKIIENEKIRK